MFFIYGLAFSSIAQSQVVNGKSDANCTATVTILYYNVVTEEVNTVDESLAPLESFTISPPTTNDKVCMLTVDMNEDGSMEIKIPANNPTIIPPVPECSGIPFTEPDPC